MSIKTEKALELHKKGYNCAQAVVCAFAEDCGVPEEEAFRIAEGFGFGMGMMEMCGAVSGMSMVIGLTNSVGNLEKGKPTKADTYQKVRTYAEKFRDKNGSYLCRELKGAGTGNVLCTCDQCIADAARMTEEYLKERQK